MPTFQLSGPKITEIRIALAAVYPTWPRFASALQDVDMQPDLLERNGLKYEENLNEVIREAAADGWLLKLIDQRLAKVPADPALQAISTFLRAYDAPAGVECFDVVRLTGSHVMVDRFAFRRALREISKPLGKRILVVMGEPKTGKSHSVQLISYVNGILGTFQLRIVDLEVFNRLRDQSQPIQPVQPLELAQRLIKLLNFRMELPAAPTDSQWSRWVLNFCDDFEAAAALRADPQWIVIDGFNSVLVSQPALDLVKELAYRINQGLRHFRLVLLGFDSSLPVQVLPTVEVEKILRISEVDLIQFFATAYEQAGVPLDEQIIASAVRRILAQVDPVDPEFLRKLAVLASYELANAAP
jgi:hypothetical protein